MNPMLLAAWRRIANNTDGPPIIHVSRINLAELLDEIDRLAAENQRLHRTR
jgi:hypothetical protein